MDRRRAGALLALAACIACSAAAPTASDHTALDLYEGAPEGCYYNFQHYGEGDRIMTNEPCLNCTCHNRMLMCYLRVCPFTKPIGQDCTIEKRADQCCPIVTCPDVPVDLLTSTSTTSPAEYGATGLGKLDKYGCSISGKYFPEGSKVPPTPNKPCEHCYCIRNMTTCVMQECTLHVDGCTPIYHKDVCCPVRYSCDHPEDEMPLLDDMSTTVRPTPGFLLTTTTLSPVTQMTQDCVHDDRIFADGASIKTEKACEHCYCMKGDIVCVVQECGSPMENEGKNCTSLPPREGQCCPDTYICEGDDLGTELPTEQTTRVVPDILTTLSPPRRTGVEGSGYRNEPDEAGYTESQPIHSEHEGSGEEQETIAPYYTTEKIATEHPVDVNEPIITTEGLYTSYTTKSPLFGEPEDTTADVTFATEHEYIPAMSSEPSDGGDDINTTEENQIPEEVPKEEGVIPQESILTTLASDIYDRITTESTEALNTVPDSVSGEENIEPHKHIPSISVGSKTESEQSTPKISDIVTETSDKEITRPGYFYPRPTTDASESVKEEDVTFDATTIKQGSEPVEYSPTTPVTSIIDADEKIIPETHEVVPSPDINIEKESTKTDSYPTSTISVVTGKDETASERATTEPSHDQNTVAVVEEDKIQPHIHSTTARIPLDEQEGSTLHSVELGSGAEDFTEENILEVHEHVTLTNTSEREGSVTTSEPDRGLNTIPGEGIDETSSEASLSERTTLSQETKATELDHSKTDLKPTTAPEYSTVLSESTVFKSDHFTITTEPSFRKEDESSVSTEKTKTPEVTTSRTDLTDEEFIPTSIQDEKLSPGHVSPSIEQEFTTSLPDNEIESNESTTVSVLEESDVSGTTSGKLPEISIEQGNEYTFGTPTTEKLSELTTLTAEVEVHEEQGRIPGEGDCLLNGITYRNNSVVPSTNNCHTGCKCVSSIIKCDPIICSAPPDYMHNCQSVYDSPDSCCPTYVCDHPRETVPPQSDNQMSGTESPLSSPAIECRGDQCEIVVDTKQPEEITDPEINQCGPNGCDGEVQKPVDSKYPLGQPEACKDGKCALPSHDCADGKCEVPAHHKLVCDVHHGCRIVPVKPCVGDDCKDIQVTPCEGDSCKNDVSSPQDTQQVPCNEEDGCKQQQSKPQECTEESCRRNEIPDSEHKLVSECKGAECVQQKDTVPGDALSQHTTVTSAQDQTSVVTEKLDTFEDLHTELPTITDSEDIPVSVTEQKPHIPEIKQDIPTVAPETSFTISNEIGSETAGLNELETNIPPVESTTSSQMYATDGSTTDKTASGIGADSEIHGYEKDTTHGADKEESTIEVTKPEQSTTEPTEDHEIKKPSTDPQTTISDIIAQEYTTAPYVADVTKEVTEISTKMPSHDQGIEIQTEQTLGEHGLSTHIPVSMVTVEDNEKNTQEADKPATGVKVEAPGIEEPVRESVIPGTSMVTDSPQIISKVTEATIEEYGFTDNLEYDMPAKKPHEVEPVRIEPQEGTTTELHQSETKADEITTKSSVILEYTEKEQTVTDLPINASSVTEPLDTKTERTQPESYVTEEGEKQTKLPELYEKHPEQHVTESQPGATISQQEIATESSPPIKEMFTDYEGPSTIEPVKSFTEIEDAFVTGQDQTTTEKSDSKETIPEDHFDESTERFEHPEIGTNVPTLPEAVTSEKEVAIKLEPSSEESTQGTSGEDIQVQIPEIKKPDSEIREQYTETPVTEKEILETTRTEPQDFITKEPHSPTEKSELGTKSPVLDIGEEEGVTSVNKSPATETDEAVTNAPIPISTVSKEVHVSVVDVTSEDEKTTNVPETDYIPVHLTSKSPEDIITEQETETEIPQKEYTKIPDLYATESNENKEPQGTTQFYEIGTKAPIGEAEDLRTGLPVEDVTESVATTKLSPVHETITQSPDIITKIPDSDKESESETTKYEKEVTETPDNAKETQPELPKQEDEATVSPVNQEKQPHVTSQEDKITKAPEDQDIQSGIAAHDGDVTKPPEYTEGFELGATRRKEQPTKIPEYTTESEPVQVTSEEKVTAPEKEPSEVDDAEGETKAPEDNSQDSQEEVITKAPEVTKEAESLVTKQDEEATKAPTDIQPESEITKLEKETTSFPDVMIQSSPAITQLEDKVTKVPEEITEHDQEVSKSPEESSPEKTGHEVTEAPEETKESLPEAIDEGEIVTKAPEDTTKSVPEVTGHEEVTIAPEEPKESLPEVTVEVEDVTKAEVTGYEEMTNAPDMTREPMPVVSGHESGVTKVPDDKKESYPEVTSHDKQVTKAPDDTKESLPDIQGHEEEVAEVPEDTKESVSEVTGHDEVVTTYPHDTKESVPVVTSPEKEVTESSDVTKEHEDEVTRTPEGTTELFPQGMDHEEEVTKSPEDTKESLPEITRRQEEVTKAPEEPLTQVTRHEEVTRVPYDEKHLLPEVTGTEEDVTKAPEDTKESLPGVTGYEEEITKAPETTQESLPEVTGHEEETTKAPEDTKESLLDVTGHEDEITKAPEDTEESLPQFTGHEAETTKAPEDTKESLPEVTGHEEKTTKAPEDTKESLPDVTGHEEVITKAPEDTEQSLPEFTEHEAETTKAPEDTKESLPEVTGHEEEITKAPEGTKESLPDVTGHEEEITKAPEDTEESLPEFIGHEAETTKAPEDTKESLPEVTGHDGEITKAPEDTEESLPELTGHEAETTNAPEDTKESLPKVTGHEEEITKAPEGTKESLPEVTGHEEEITKAPEDTKESLPEVIGHEEEITKAPEGTYETHSGVGEQEGAVTKVPEDTKTSLPEIPDHEDSVPEITGHGEEVTKAPEDTNVSQPEVTGHDEGVTKAPEDMKEPISEVTGLEGEVTKAPEDSKESLPVTGHEEITETPEDTKESLPEVADHVTKAPEETKESFPAVTGHEEEVTKTPEDTKVSLPEVTEHEGEVTKAPEEPKESLPAVTSHEEDVTKVPEDTKEPPHEVTGYDGEVTNAPEGTKESLPEEEVTKTPEVQKESIPEVTDHVVEVTKAQEETKESLPAVTDIEEEVTKTPEDSKESPPEVTGHEGEVTKAPEETKDSTPIVTGHEDEVTKSPEDIKESLPEVTAQEEEVTKAPEHTNESLPEVTEEEVTKAPEGMKEAIPVTGHEEITETPEDEKESLPEVTDYVTKAPEETKESFPAVTGHEDEVTKSPEDTKESPAVTGYEGEATKGPEDTSESVPDVTSHGEEVTKAAEVSLTEVTRRQEVVTKAPVDMIESLPEVTGYEVKVTKGPEDSKDQESQTDVTGQGETVTKSPEKSEPEVTELISGEDVTEKQETAPTEHPVSDTKVTEDTTHKQIKDITTEQPEEQFSETTPQVVILEEHTHRIEEEITTISPSHEEPVLAITSEKPTDERIEVVTKESEITTEAKDESFTVSGQTQSHTTSPALDLITEKVPTSSVPIEEIPSDQKHDEVLKEKEPTSVPVLDETTTSDKSPAVTDTELPIPTETVPVATELPVHQGIVYKTTVPDDELIMATTKATTSKQEEELVTPAAVNKPSKPEEKPIESSEATPSAELPKPIPAETQPTDELPTPEDDSNFPPSGISGYGEPDYVEEDQALSPGTCRYGGKVYVSAQQIPRDDPCDFCFCFRSDIICLQQSCPPPIHGCHEEPIQGFCCPRYECPVSMATTVNVTTTTTTTTTTLPPHFPTHSYKGAAQRRGCQIKGHTYKVGEVVRSASGPCLHCTCGGDGQMKCDPKACTPEPMLRQMIAAAVSAKRRR